VANVQERIIRTNALIDQIVYRSLEQQEFFQS